MSKYQSSTLVSQVSEENQSHQLKRFSSLVDLFRTSIWERAQRRLLERGDPFKTKTWKTIGRTVYLSPLKWTDQIIFTASLVGNRAMLLIGGWGATQLSAKPIRSRERSSGLFCVLLLLWTRHPVQPLLLHPYLSLQQQLGFLHFSCFFFCLWFLKDVLLQCLHVTTQRMPTGSSNQLKRIERL